MIAIVPNSSSNNNNSTSTTNNNNSATTSSNDPSYHHQVNTNTMDNNNPTANSAPESTSSLTKRTVIIHKDSKGYGMRISGDNPVFIQHVNEDGAAYKSGVRSGDQIIKVNGTLVTKLGHADVVRMIQGCGSFVGLTLLSNNASYASQPANAPTAIVGPSVLDQTPNILQQSSQSQSQSRMTPANSPTPPMVFSPMSNPLRITGPQPVPESTQQQYHENQIRTLQEMIANELRHLEEKKLMRASQQELERCQKRINEMRAKLEIHQNTISSSSNNNNQHSTMLSHSRQHSFENQINNNLLTNTEFTSAISGNRIMPMDDDVDLDMELPFPMASTSAINNNNSTQQPTPYEYIEDLDLYDKLQDTITGTIPAKSTNQKAPIMRNSTTGNKDKEKRSSKIFMSSIFSGDGIHQQIGSQSSPTIQQSTSNLTSSSILTTKAWFNLHLDSLRFCRYLIQQKSVWPNEVLFYVMAKTVFPRIAVQVPMPTKGQVIQRWAYQIIATFIFKESPLYMQDFPQDYLEQFDKNLTALINANPSATDVVASPFEPFLVAIHRVVREQWTEFMMNNVANPANANNNSTNFSHHSSMNSPSSNHTSKNDSKHDLQSTIETLLAAQLQIQGTPKLGLRDIDKILDAFVQNVPINNKSVTIMALISCLLAIGRYIFGITQSKHCLLLETSAPSSLASNNVVNSSNSALNAFQSLNTIAVSSSLNPLLKLSSETSHTKKSGQKRHSVIPYGSKSFSSSHSLGNSFDSSSILSSLTNGQRSNSSAAHSQSSTSGSIGHCSLSTSTIAIEDRGHCFIPIMEMSHTLYCTHCLLPMWGDPYSLKCSKCLMDTHLWCYKVASANNYCNNDTQQQQLPFNQHRSSNQQRRPKSEKKSNKIFEKFTGKKTSKRHDLRDMFGTTSTSNNAAGNLNRSSSSSSLSDTNSSSSSDSEHDLSFMVGTTSDFDDHFSSPQQNSQTTTATNTTPTATTSTPAPIPSQTSNTAANVAIVNRSGSFVQRKKKKSSTSIGSPRKRSDPALTSKQISTMSGGVSVIAGSTVVAEQTGQLSGARSSGALMNSASVGAHDCQIRPITGQRAKHMTASDSSLMSNSSAASKMAKQIPTTSSNMTGSGAVSSTVFASNAPCDSNKSSSTNLTSTTSSPSRHHRTTRHRNTNDSAIQMDASSEDDLNDLIEPSTGQPQPPEQVSNEALNLDTDAAVPPPPPPPPPPNSNGVPPPLPPRPDSQTEKRRQIQMEIIQTESDHFDVLCHLREFYQKQLRNENLLTREQINIIFGDIKKLKNIHKKIFNKLKSANRMQQHFSAIGTQDVHYMEEAVHDIFCGELGEQLEKEASLFCVNRKIRNGVELWNQRKKDPRFRIWMDSESRARGGTATTDLARLGLDDLLSRVFQRPLRYPLLIERLLKSTPKDSAGYQYLEKALISCRRIGERINEETKKAELRVRFQEILRKTDFSNFTGTTWIDHLEQHELLHEGPLVWRISKQKLVDVLLVVTDQIILVLTKESNDRYVLKQHRNPTTQHGHRPDIKMDDLLLRNVATDPAAFFLVSKNQDIIYEFAGQSSSECNKWKDAINKAIEANNPQHNTSALAQLVHHQHSSQRSFTSQRSMTMMDLKSSANADSSDVPPPLPPPSILNRPLPKLPSSHSDHSSPPPPPPPPYPSSASSSSTFLNRPLPKPPVNESSVEQSSQVQHQPKLIGSMQYVTSSDIQPSMVDLVPFSQVRQDAPLSHRVAHRSKSELSSMAAMVAAVNAGRHQQEINDNIKNLLRQQEQSPKHKSNESNMTLNLEDLEKEIQEMSLVYDVAKHDSLAMDDSKETLARLITDMFRKATEWSYHFVQDNEPAKHELSQRVRNPIESFVKLHIDPNFILPLPDDVEPEQQTAKTTNTKQHSTKTSSSNSILRRIKRSLSDKSNEKSDKNKEAGLDILDHSTCQPGSCNNENTEENTVKKQIEGNIYDMITNDFDDSVNAFNDQQMSSVSPNPFDDENKTKELANGLPLQSCSTVISPTGDIVSQSSSASSNPFLQSASVEINTEHDDEFVLVDKNEQSDARLFHVPTESSTNNINEENVVQCLAAQQPSKRSSVVELLDPVQQQVVLQASTIMSELLTPTNTSTTSSKDNSQQDSSNNDNNNSNNNCNQMYLV